MANRGILPIALLSLGVLHMGGDAWAAGKKDKKDKKVEETDLAAVDEASESSVEPPVVAEEVELPPAATVGYDRGFFVTDGGVNRLAIGGRVQGLFDFTSADRGDADRFNSHAFSIPRARLTLQGQTLTTKLSYKFQTDFGKGQASLKDYYLDYQMGEGSLHLRGGQFKKVFSRQQEASTANMQFIDRSIVDAHFENGRDIGLMLHNNYFNSPATEWALGVVNGTGDKGVFVPEIDPMSGAVVGGEFSNVPAKVRPAIFARVGHNSDGIDGYNESDFQGGDLRFGVAATVMSLFEIGAGEAITQGGVDFVVKQEGFAVSGGVYADLRGPKIADLSYAGIAAYAQVGYMLEGGYEPALRYALIAEDGGNSRQEVSGAFSLYEFGDDLKLVTDLSLLASDDGAAKRKDIRGRSQIQLIF